MRYESSVTTISWIPSEAITGPMGVPIDMGIGHYDDPPPDVLDGLDHLEELRKADRFRFANDLRPWGKQAGAASVVLFHHDPPRTDAEVDDLLAAARRTSRAVVVCAATADMTLDVPTATG